ncbi:MAG: hypothetical protein WD989_00415 [Candidatus Paceibacterota bacterium]
MSRIMNVILAVLVVVLVSYCYILNKVIDRANMKIATLTLQLQKDEKALDETKGQVDPSQSQTTTESPGSNVRMALEFGREYKAKNYPKLVKELETEAASRGWNVRSAAFMSDERYAKFLEKLLSVGMIDTHGIIVVAANSFEISRQGEMWVDTDATIEDIINFLKQ